MEDVYKMNDYKAYESYDSSLEGELELFEKQLDSLKGGFLTNISHELRTPIALIYSNIHLLEKNLNIDKRASDLKSQEYIGTIKKNTLRILRIINNMLEVSNIDAGCISINMEKCNIVKVVEEMILSVVEPMKKINVKLVFDTDIEEAIVYADIKKIEKVILNLLSNSVKYSKGNTDVIINVIAYEENGQVCISFKDNGIGIPEEFGDKIYDKFRQWDSSTTRKTEGSGIGLHLVKMLLNMQNADIDYVSKLHEGSEFIIKFKPCEYTQEEYEEICTTCYSIRMDNFQVEFSDISL